MPLFIILGLLYCMVSFLLQRSEFNWSVDQEAESIGATIHEFVIHDFDLYFSTTDDGRLTITEQFERVIDRLSLQQDILEITIFDQEMAPLYSRTATDILSDRRTGLESANSSDNIATAGIMASYEELSGLPGGERPPYHYNLNLDEDEPVLSIYSYLYDAQTDSSISSSRDSSTEETGIVLNESEDVAVQSDISTDHALIVVRKDADSHAVIRAGITRWTIIEFLASVLAGLVVSLTLSFVLKRSVDDLHLKSGEIISGKDGSQEADSSIYEFNELGNTMQMLVNVLGKNVEGYRKRIIENEQMRTPMEIASTFKKISNPEFNNVRFQRHFRYGLINDHTPGYFVSHIDLPGETIILTGFSEGNDPLETALASDAISRQLMRRLTDNANRTEKKLSVTEIVKSFQEQFSVNELKLKIIRIMQSGEVIIIHFDGDNTEETNFSKNHRETVVVSYFPVTLSNRINNYRRLVNGRYAEDLFDDIKTLSKGFNSGVLVTISPLINSSTDEE